MSERKQRFARGLAWTAGYQVVEAIASFAAMLVLVRLIPPAEYGRAASATGILMFLNLWSARAFLDHALQLPDSEEPDWTRHWTIAWYLQGALFLLTHLTALVLSKTEALAPVAPLLHIGAFGILIEGPAYLSATMMRRSLDIARLRVLLGLSVLLKIAGTIALAGIGFGAVAIVAGGTIFTAVPMTLDLFFVRGWRPAPHWWRAPDWASSRDVLRFGSQRVASGLLSGSRALIEGLVLPATIGYEAVGLLGRAQALFSATVGRLAAAAIDTAYPFVSRTAAEPTRFARWSGGLLLGSLLAAIPGSVFLVLHGRLVTTVLYGEQWLGLTPFIVPGVAAALGGLLATTAATVLLAGGRLRSALGLDLVSCSAAAIAAALTLAVPSARAYASMLAIGSIVAGVGGLWWQARIRPSNPAILDLVAPVIVSSAVGAAMSVGLTRVLGSLPETPRLGLIALGFLAGATATLMLGFRGRIRPLEGLIASLRLTRAEETNALAASPLDDISATPTLPAAHPAEVKGHA